VKIVNEMRSVALPVRTHVEKIHEFSLHVEHRSFADQCFQVPLEKNRKC